jgi:uncharacterized damage-inducible protein DinB
MKQHFLRLFEYDHLANNLVYTALRDFPPATDDAGPDPLERPTVLMAHLLAASRNWSLRCQGKSSAGLELWPKPQWGEMGDLMEANAKGWKAFLEGEADFGRKMIYQNQAGETFTNDLTDILAHVINHGTHHRAQIGQRLQAAGLEHLPATDYIVYLRLKGL